MKIKPKIYAELLLESAKTTERKKVVSGFWHLLQKNKQYKDLTKILDEMEKLYAEKNGEVIAYVESGKELNTEELGEIKKKLSVYCHSREGGNLKDPRVPTSQMLRGASKPEDDKRIILKTKINPSITGITAKIDGKMIDLTIEEKISKLRKQINQ